MDSGMDTSWLQHLLRQKSMETWAQRPKSSGMNQPKVQTDIPADGVSPENNPTGKTPHGIPEALMQEDANALPSSGRIATEVAPLVIEKAGQAGS